MEHGADRHDQADDYRAGDIALAERLCGGKAAAPQEVLFDLFARRVHQSVFADAVRRVILQLDAAIVLLDRRGENFGHKIRRGELHLVRRELRRAPHSRRPRPAGSRCA